MKKLKILLLSFILIGLAIGIGTFISLKPIQKEVIGVVYQKKDNKVDVLFEETINETRIITIFDNNYEINDVLLLNVSVNKKQIDVNKVSIKYDENWTSNSNDIANDIIKIMDNELLKNYSKTINVTAGIGNEKLNVYVLPIKIAGKYIKSYSPSKYMENYMHICDCLEDRVRLDKNENVKITISLPENTELLSFNDLNGSVSYEKSDNQVIANIHNPSLSSIYYGVLKMTDGNIIEMILDIKFF